MRTLLLILTSSCMVYCLPPPHPAVVAARQEEELLPPQLRSRALHNPHLYQILPLTSLLHNGEHPVFNRDTDKVSRRDIYNILTHAGLISRRFSQRHFHPNLYQRASPQEFDHSFFINPELLQRL